MQIAKFTITADDMKENETGFINLIEHMTIKVTTKGNKYVLNKGEHKVINTFCHYN